MLLEFDYLGYWDETYDPSNMIMFPNSFKEHFFGANFIEIEGENVSNDLNKPEDRFKLCDYLFNMSDIYLANI